MRGKTDSMAVVFIGLLVLSLQAAPVEAQAQESKLQPTDELSSLQEIVVTAQKRGEDIEKVPISINAFSGQDLETQGIVNTQQLQLVTSGLVFSTFNQGAQPYIRGIGTDQATTDSESAVGLYVDGVYVANIYRGIQEFNDVERVEVLKGPQGTLYGRNTTGGAINVITRDPTQDFEAGGSVDYGSHDTVRAKASVSGGIIDNVAASLAVFRTSHEGYQYNLFDGQRMDNENLTGARGKLKVELGNNWTAVFMGEASSDHSSGGCCFSYISPNPLVAALGGRYSTSPQDVVNDYQGYSNFDDRNASIHVRAQYPSFTFVSISGWDDYRRYGAVDVDSSNLPVANSSALPQTNDSYSQEFQLLSPADSRIQWIAGLFGFYDTASFNPNLGGNGVDAATFTDIFAAEKSEAYAAFGQITYPVTDEFSITAGLRYNSDLKKLTQSELFLPPTGVTTEYPLSSRRWNKALPKITLQYDTGPSLYYVTASKGFRSGAYNLTALGSAPVNPEDITAVEVGGKHKLIDNRLEVNWAAYHYNYQNLQVSVIESNGANAIESVLENAASERSYGLDLDLAATPFQGFEARLAFAYLHARYESFPNASIYVPNTAIGYGNASVTGNASGDVASRAPTYTSSLNLSYLRNIGVGDLSFSGTYYVTDKVFFDANDRVSQPGYGMLNLRSQLAVGTSGVTVGLFADNLTNKRAIVGVVETVLGDIGQFTPPRIVGVSLNAKFK